MKKILIVNSYYAPTIIGGAEISTQLLAEGLTKYYKVSVLTTGLQKEGILKEVINGVTVFRIPCMNIYWPPQKGDPSSLAKLVWHSLNNYNAKQFRLIKSLLIEIKPDIIHTQNLMNIGTYIWSIAKELDINIVHTIRDYALQVPVNNKFLNSIFSKFNRKRSNNVNCVVGISRFVLEFFKNKNFFEGSKGYVIHNIVNAQRFERRIRKNGEPLRIGYFGQIEEIKGIQLLVEAMRKLDHKIVKELIICGTGSLENKLRKETILDSRIVFKGKLSTAEVYKQMAHVDLTIVPSIWEEPFGRVIIESYNQGTPVIAGNVGGIPDLIFNKKLLLPHINVDQLSKNIENYYYLSENQKNKLIIDSYRESEKYKDNISLYIDIYENLFN